MATWSRVSSLIGNVGTLQAIYCHWYSLLNVDASGNKLMTLRRVYQKAIVLPLEGLEDFWKVGVLIPR